jgi:hypothetical protein
MAQIPSTAANDRESFTKVESLCYHYTVADALMIWQNLSFGGDCILFVLSEALLLRIVHHRDYFAYLC